MTSGFRQLGRLADNRGGAALEFALVLPALTVFVFGVWYMGWAVNLGSEVGHAVEQGARIYISNPNASSDDLKTAVSSHLMDVPIDSITLNVSQSTIGLATSEHVTWSFQTTAPIPLISAIPITFTGSYDTPLATP